jgi:propionate CoA-transferase
LDLRTKAGLLLHIAKWRLTWGLRDTDYRPRGLPYPKFITAREAATRIPDGATVLSSGMAGNTRCSIFFWAIQERFRKHAGPRGLTWITVGAQGGRGMVPGTLEELGDRGLVTRYIGGHVETVKALLARAQEGECELHLLPQGVQTFLIEAQIRGERAIESPVGVGTFLDPRVGAGSCVVPGKGESLAAPAGDLLRYTMPRIDVALFTAAAADAEGNLYNTHAPMTTESRDSALAARRNGGLVLAAVAEIVPKNEAAIYLPADRVDGIVVNPRNEQTGSVPQRKYWPMFTAGAKVDPVDAVARLKFANDVLGITPRRDPVDNALARAAAWVFTQVVPRGAAINIGVGHPEEVCRLVFEAGIHADVTFTTETGVFGGLPTPGVFFGAAINPEKIITSGEMFHFYQDHLNTTVLGLLQADEAGNVNVSRRGAGPVHTVGPGGFPDITTYARNVIFVGTWMAHAEMAIRDGKLAILKPGTPKFVPAVDEITFSGRAAANAGKRVFYVTNVGIFRLTPSGMELIAVMPGIDVKRDILGGCAMRVVLPAGREVAVLDRSIVTGEGFRLAWATGKDRGRSPLFENG